MQEGLTLASNCSKVSQIPRPIPEAPPVTKATRPEIFIVLKLFRLSSYNCCSFELPYLFFSLPPHSRLGSNLGPSRASHEQIVKKEYFREGSLKSSTALSILCAQRYSCDQGAALARKVLFSKNLNGHGSKILVGKPTCSDFRFGKEENDDKTIFGNVNQV